jgi:cystathionine beta-lyase/cystathionine gamma-synthase
LTQIDQAGSGDIIHVETPLNPTGEARNLAYYRAKASEKGAYLTVDSTFAPPPLQNPLDFGADIVMHSGTKYVGGHSDMLCGILVIHPDRVEEGWLKTLHTDRQYIGSVMGSLEGWLGIRSTRTMQLRVARQAQTAEMLVAWLQEQLKDLKYPVGKVLSHVQHASIQEEI